MNRMTLIILIAGVVVGCNDPSGELGEGGSVTIDTFNVALAGQFVEFEDERRPLLVEAIAGMDSDIVCLQEVFEQSDKDLISDAASERFPHVVMFEDTLDTALNDATDQQGEVPPPPPPGFVPCPPIVPPNSTMGETIEDQVNTVVDCVAANCSTTGNDQGQMTNFNCVLASCLDVALPLAFGDEQQQQCYACGATQLAAGILADIRVTCPSIPNQNLTYEGQNGVMILSRYPLSDVAEWVIPGTWTRRVIINATAELPNGSELDIYCNHLTPIFSNPAFLYTGQYGGDAVANTAKWEAEQFLQAQKLITRVQNTSGDTPTVILGDLNTGLAFPGQTIIAEGPSTLELLESEFPPAYTTEYVPQCTFCDTNPITGVSPGESVWIDHILLRNLSTDSVVSTERTFDQDVVPVDTPEGPIDIPLSDHFGMRSVIEVP